MALPLPGSTYAKAFEIEKCPKNIKTAKIEKVFPIFTFKRNKSQR